MVGLDPESGAEITAQNGRYGAYLKKGTDTRSLASEDQIFEIDLAGAICVTWVGTTFSGLPALVAIPVGFVAGAVGGLAWSVVPAWLKRRAGIDEVVTTLLLNPVALLVVQGLLNGPWRNSSTGFTDSDRLGAGYELPLLISGSRAHLGLLVALVLLGRVQVQKVRVR